MKKHTKLGYYKVYKRSVDRIYHMIKNINKFPQFMEIFSEKFDSKMNWENYGKYWEVDHIISGIYLAKSGLSVDEINDFPGNEKYSNVRPLEIYKNRQRKKNNEG